jgi:hypothetical protein
MRIEEPAVDTADAADVAEQRAGLDDTAFDETALDDTPFVGSRTELPLEADPADVVEQDADVPLDDER